MSASDEIKDLLVEYYGPDKYKRLSKKLVRGTNSDGVELRIFADSNGNQYKVFSMVDDGESNFYTPFFNDEVMFAVWKFDSDYNICFAGPREIEKGLAMNEYIADYFDFIGKKLPGYLDHAAENLFQVPQGTISFEQICADLTAAGFKFSAELTERLDENENGPRPAPSTSQTPMIYYSASSIGSIKMLPGGMVMLTGNFVGGGGNLPPTGIDDDEDEDDDDDDNNYRPFKKGDRILFGVYDDPANGMSVGFVEKGYWEAEGCIHDQQLDYIFKREGIAIPAYLDNEVSENTFVPQEPNMKRVSYGQLYPTTITKMQIIGDLMSLGFQFDQNVDNLLNDK